MKFQTKDWVLLAGSTVVFWGLDEILYLDTYAPDYTRLVWKCALGATIIIVSFTIPGKH